MVCIYIGYCVKITMAETITYPWSALMSFAANVDGISFELAESTYPEPESLEAGAAGGEGEVVLSAEGDAKSFAGLKIGNDSFGVVLDEKHFFFKDDKLIIPDVVIAKQMVQDYGGKKVLKCGEELEKTVRFLDGIPITVVHPENGIVTNPDEIHGFGRNPRFLKDSNSIAVDFVIDSKTAIEDIRAGRRNVSIGFMCECVPQSGVLNDEKYDYVQKNFLPNHVAIVDVGRCSLEDGCGITSLANSINQVGNDSMKKELASLKARVAAADKVLLEKKTELADRILAITDSVSKDELLKKGVDELGRSLETFVKVQKNALTAKTIAGADAAVNEEKVDVDEVYKKAFG